MANEYIREIVPVSRLHPYPLSENIFGVLSDPEMHDLIEDIAKFGLRNTIEVNQDYQVICGSQRLRAIKELQWETVEVKRRLNPWDEEDLQEYLIKDNLHRRHLSIEQQYKAGRKLKEIYAIQAAKRQQLGTLDDTSSKGRATERVAVDIGISHDSFEQMEKIFESDQEEIIEKVKRGELSISAAVQEIKIAHKAHEAVKLDPDSDRSLALKYFKWQEDARQRVQQIERVRHWFLAHPPVSNEGYQEAAVTFLEEMKPKEVIRRLHETVVRCLE